MSRTLYNLQGRQPDVGQLAVDGMVFEDDNPDMLAEAMAALEKGLTKWFKDQRIDLG